MEFINRVSTSTDFDTILNDLTKDITTPYDLGILFINPMSGIALKDLVSKLQENLFIKDIIGCTCAGIISSQKEIERKPAISLILAQLPDVKISPFYLNQSELEGLKTKQQWLEFFEIFPNEEPIFLCLPDPFSVDVHAFLDGINASYPNCPMVGGLASAASAPNENLIIINQDFYNQGIVGVVLTGNIKLKTVVSQGCRPIGKTYIVTKSEENIIYELGGQPLVNILQDILEKVSTEDRLLAQEALFIGIAMNEYKEHLAKGDFLIRGLIGLDAQNGAGAIADYIKTGQTIQFHVRDAQTATEDLNNLLSSHQKQVDGAKPKGALVFSCNGRGEFLFQEPNHDIKIIQNHLGPIQAAGFFCAGEIGPIGSNNFLHGFTDSIALFYPKT